MIQTWQLQEAKNKLSRVIENAVNSGPQIITKHGVEGELLALPGDSRLTDPQEARSFVRRTGVDALAVNVGQAHLHGRSTVQLNLARLADLQTSIPVPLVLHGASSINRPDMQEAIRLGIRKINVGSTLKRAFFEAVRSASGKVVVDDYNPYETVGSGLVTDAFAAGRLALQERAEDLNRLFGSAGKAW